MNLDARGRNGTRLYRRWKRVHAFRWSYLFIMPGVVLLFLFAYMPMAGAMIAFKDYRIYQGIMESPWVGFENFYFVSDPYFWQSVKNTLAITIYRMVFGFPAPIILALLLNEIQSVKYKRLIQSTSYLPHFISWIVITYMLGSILALDTGIVNSMLSAFGFSQINFMGEPDYFRFLVVSSGIWKELGWGTIIYLAALTGINPELTESAMLDGAGRFKRIIHINIPGIMPTIAILLILQMPALLTAGYEQIYPLVNPANLELSNVLDVYLIRLGLLQSQYSVAAAIGLVQAIVQLGLVLGVNAFIKKQGQEGLW